VRRYIIYRIALDSVALQTPCPPANLPGAAHDLQNPLSEVLKLDTLKEAKLSTEKRLIVEALEKTRGNVEAAAKILGKHGSVLHRLIKRHGLRAIVAKLRYEASMDRF
jgi:transcriptional regulator with GAF, ATPase, and Fis domain